MPRAYFPLVSVSYPPIFTLRNGVRVASREFIQPADMNDLTDIFTGRELRHLREWQHGLVLEAPGGPGVIGAYADVHYKLADANLALQVVAPTGNHLSVSIEEDDPLLFDEKGLSVSRRLRSTTHHLRFYGTTWSRMAGYAGMAIERVVTITNGVLEILASGDARSINPLRLYEHGLNSTNPYLRVFLWTSAMDGILMAKGSDLFEERLCSLLGDTTLVFPPADEVFFERSTTVADVAKDIYRLRSEVAHGAAISKMFHMQKEDMRPLLPLSAYGGEPPRYFQLIEEATLSLLRRLLHKIIEDDLLGTFRDVKSWRVLLKRGLVGHSPEKSVS